MFKALGAINIPHVLNLKHNKKIEFYYICIQGEKMKYPYSHFILLICKFVTIILYRIIYIYNNITNVSILIELQTNNNI